MVPAWLPAWLPAPPQLVALSGVAELCGAAGLLVPQLRQAAGWALIALLVAVFPANVEMLRRAQAGQGSALWQALLWLRLPLQALLIWWIWRAAARGRSGGRARERGAPPTEKLRSS